MKSQILKFLALPIFLLAIGAGSSGCQNVDESLNVLENVTIVKTSYKNMSEDYDKAKKVYADNREFFTKAEQKTIDNGLQSMNKARAGLKNINDAKDAGKIIALGDFINSYTDGKKGYLLIRSVLIARKDDLNAENKALFNRFDNAAQALDKAVVDLKPGGEVGDRVDQFMTLISTVSRLFLK